MKINITNIEKLNKAIQDSEGRATARTITADDIINVLNRIKVPKNKLNGTRVMWDGAEHFPNAYKYVPESTHWTAVNTNGRWYVVDIYRAACPNRSTRRGRIIYSEEAKEWIINKASDIT